MTMPQLVGNSFYQLPPKVTRLTNKIVCNRLASVQDSAWNPYFQVSVL